MTVNIGSLDNAQAIGWSGEAFTRLGVGSVQLNSSLTIVGRALVSAGTLAAPSIGAPGLSVGMNIEDATAVTFVSSGQYSLFVARGGVGLRMRSDTFVGWTAGNANAAADTGFGRIAAGIAGVRAGASGGAAFSFIEMTAPAAPAADGVYVYAEDNGAGKTRLMARFATGAAQQIAIEP
jgi:hypothetical protein